MFGKDLRRMDEYLNKEALGKQFGQAGVYDNAKINFPNPWEELTGSRIKDNARIVNVQKWGKFPHQERGKVSK